MCEGQYMRRRPYEGPEARPHMRNDLSFQTMMSTQVRPSNALELLGRSASAGLTLQFTMSLRRRLAFRIGMAGTEPLCFSAIAAKCWWSQTGSNRRPHACKARALPTELWPLNSRGRPQLGSRHRSTSYPPEGHTMCGGPRRTRTADLTLIRRVL